SQYLFTFSLLGTPTSGAGCGKRSWCSVAKISWGVHDNESKVKTALGRRTSWFERYGGTYGILCSGALKVGLCSYLRWLFP
ncbi:hypothetical protein Tco_0027727, partial [Tanacetum coccineum]